MWNYNNEREQIQPERNCVIMFTHGPITVTTELIDHTAVIACWLQWRALFSSRVYTPLHVVYQWVYARPVLCGERGVKYTVTHPCLNGVFVVDHHSQPTTTIRYTRGITSSLSTLCTQHTNVYILRLFTARCTLVQSAVLRSHVVCPSVCPSVRPSVRLWRWWIVIT